MSNNHPCHKSEITKLNRIAGQIEGVKRMIDEGRYCPDILAQLRAIRSATRTVEANILETHLGHCVSDAIKGNNKADRDKKLQEIKDLFKRYDEV